MNWAIRNHGDDKHKRIRNKKMGKEISRCEDEWCLLWCKTISYEVKVNEKDNLRLTNWNHSNSIGLTANFITDFVSKFHNWIDLDAFLNSHKHPLSRSPRISAINQSIFPTIAIVNWIAEKCDESSDYCYEEFKTLVTSPLACACTISKRKRFYMLLWEQNTFYDLWEFHDVVLFIQIVSSSVDLIPCL